MSLKQAREELQTDVSYYFNSVATRGGIATVSTGGSGVAIGDQGSPTSPLPLAAYAANPSGLSPIGVLLTDTVDIDTTRYHENFHKEEVDIPEKVTLLKKGWCVTDLVYPGETPSDGDLAYVQDSGYVTPTVHSVGGTAATPRVGTFRSSKDENGYAKLEVNLPY